MISDVIFCHMFSYQKINIDSIFSIISKIILLQQHDVRTSCGLTAWITYAIGHGGGWSLENFSGLEWPSR